VTGAGDGGGDHGGVPSLNRTAVSATLHCLTGCAIGEVLGMVIGTALGWGAWQTVGLATCTLRTDPRRDAARRPPARR
jgi:hypothetical protein